MTERGVVVKVKGRRATVRFDRRSACDSCHMCAVTRDGMKVEVVVDNTLGALVGDFVEVAMGDKYVLTAAVIVYIIPLVLTAVGLGIGSLISEIAEIAMSIGGLVAGFVIAFLLDRFVIKKKSNFAPKMKAICPEILDYPEADAGSETKSMIDTSAEANVSTKDKPEADDGAETNVSAESKSKADDGAEADVRAESKSKADDGAEADVNAESKSKAEI